MWVGSPVDDTARTRLRTCEDVVGEILGVDRGGSRVGRHGLAHLGGEALAPGLDRGDDRGGGAVVDELALGEQRHVEAVRLRFEQRVALQLERADEVHELLGRVVGGGLGVGETGLEVGDVACGVALDERGGEGLLGGEVVEERALRALRRRR